MSIIENTQNEAIFARSTLANLLIRKINEIRAVASIDTCCLLLPAAYNSTLLISYDVVLKLTSIFSIFSMVYTTKIELWMCWLHASAFSNDSEALRQGPALKTLLTHVWIDEDLTGDRRQQEGGGEGAHTPLELGFEVLWAIRMGSPQRHSHSKNNNTKDIYLNAYLGSNSKLKFTTGVGLLKCWENSGTLHTNYYCGVTPRPKRRIYRCRIYRSEYTAPNAFRLLTPHLLMVRPPFWAKVATTITLTTFKGWKSSVNPASLANYRPLLSTV